MDAETSSVLLERLKKQKEERMTFNPETHHRHSIRLTHYDYSQPGYYFITLCTRDKECLFIDVENNHLVLNEIGRVVNKIWNNLPGHFSGIELDKMVIMPNHLHGIIVITDCRGGVIPPFGVFPPNKIIPPISNEGARTAPLQHGKTLGQMIAWFKYESTKEINRNVSGNPSVKIWQRNYFERIVRNDEELDRIRDYIATNPETWEEDENNA